MTKHVSNHFTIETKQEEEEDGRWIAEILEISGALVYGNSQQEAIANVQVLALRVIADQSEQEKLQLTMRGSFDARNRS
jgi:predicted RNase H-like HicB family nuclease